MLANTLTAPEASSRSEQASARVKFYFAAAGSLHIVATKKRNVNGTAATYVAPQIRVDRKQLSRSIGTGDALNCYLLTLSLREALAACHR